MCAMSRLVSVATITSIICVLRLSRRYACFLNELSLRTFKLAIIKEVRMCCKGLTLHSLATTAPTLMALSLVWVWASPGWILPAGQYLAPKLTSSVMVHRLEVRDHPVFHPPACSFRSLNGANVFVSTTFLYQCS